jgi:hypothetical protein
VVSVASRAGASPRPRSRNPGSLCGVRGGGAAGTGLRRADSEARAGEGGGEDGGGAEAGRVGRLLPVKYGSSCGPGVGTHRCSLQDGGRGAARRRNCGGMGSSWSTPFSSSDGWKYRPKPIPVLSVKKQ